MLIIDSHLRCVSHYVIAASLEKSLREYLCEGRASRRRALSSPACSLECSVYLISLFDHGPKIPVLRNIVIAVKEGRNRIVCFGLFGSRSFCVTLQFIRHAAEISETFIQTYLAMRAYSIQCKNSFMLRAGETLASLDNGSDWRRGCYGRSSPSFRVVCMTDEEAGIRQSRTPTKRL